MENQLKNGRENILGIVKCIVKSKTEILHSFIPEKDVNGKLNFFNVRLRKQICTLSLNILKEIYFSHEYEIEIIEVILFESIQCELLQRFAKEIIKMRHNTKNMLEIFLIKQIILQGIGRFSLRIDNFQNTQTTLINNQNDLNLMFQMSEIQSFKPLNSNVLCIQTKIKQHFNKSIKMKLSFRNRTNPFMLAFCSDTVKIFMNLLKKKFENLPLIKTIRVDTDSISLLYHKKQEAVVQEKLNSYIFSFKLEIDNIVYMENNLLAKTKFILEDGKVIIKVPGLRLESEKRNIVLEDKTFDLSHGVLGNIIVNKNVISYEEPYKY